MFIQSLSQKQQAFFLGLAEKLAQVDGVYDDKEKAKVQEFYNQMPGIAASFCDTEKLIDIFDSKKSRSSAMLELIGLALVGEDFADEEKKMLEGLASVFEIEPSKLAEMTSWVSRMFYMFREAQSFMED